MKEAQKEAESGVKAPKVDFDDWADMVAKENASTLKEKIGVKKKK